MLQALSGACYRPLCLCTSPTGDFPPALFELPQLVHAADPPAVPDVAQMHALAKILDEPRPVDGQAFAAGMPHAVVGDSIRAAAFQLTAEYLRRDVAVGIVDVGHAGAHAADVMKSRRDVGQVAAHVELERALPR